MPAPAPERLRAAEEAETWDGHVSLPGPLHMWPPLHMTRCLSMAPWAEPIQCDRAGGHDGLHVTEHYDRSTRMYWLDEHVAFATEESNEPPIRTTGPMPARRPTRAITS